MRVRYLLSSLRYDRPKIFPHSHPCKFCARPPTIASIMSCDVIANEVHFKVEIMCNVLTNQIAVSYKFTHEELLSHHPFHPPPCVSIDPKPALVCCDDNILNC